MDGSDFENYDLMQVFTAAVANHAAGRPSIEVDAAEFLHLLEEIDAPLEEKLELINILIAIMSEFVDMGFGIHPVQQACGQLPETERERSEADSELLSSEFNERKLE